MSVRKTVKVALILERTNHYLRESADECNRERQAIMDLCGVLLSDAGAYAGFNYLPSAGVNYDAIEHGETFAAADETRTFFYTHKGLS